MSEPGEAPDRLSTPTPARQEPNLTLELWSSAGDVVVVRQVLAGIAELLGLEATKSADVATAVTEACNNVVTHAYANPDGGRMTVELMLDQALLTLIVSDRGIGVSPRPVDPSLGIGGLGIPLMLSLADTVQFTDRRDSGTSVLLAFNVDPVDEALVLDGSARITRGAPAADWAKRATVTNDHLEAGGAVLVARPAALAAVALARVARVLAARARFTASGLADVETLSHRIAEEGASEAPGMPLGCAVLVSEGELEMRTFARLADTGLPDGDTRVVNQSELTRAILAAR